MHEQPTPVILALGADVHHARYDQLIILGLQQRSRGTYEILLDCESVYVLKRGASLSITDRLVDITADVLVS